MKSLLILGDVSQSMQFLRRLSGYRHPIMIDRYTIEDELVPINYLPVKNVSSPILANHTAIILVLSGEMQTNKKYIELVEPMCRGRLFLYQGEEDEPFLFTKSIIEEINQKQAKQKTKKSWHFWQRQITTITPLCVLTRIETVKS